MYFLTIQITKTLERFIWEFQGILAIAIDLAYQGKK